MASILFHGLSQLGLPVVCVESRQAYQALKSLATHKTDRNDARGLAQLIRMGWFRPVHVKTAPAQEVRALLTARHLLQRKLHDVELGIRGLLRGFGLKVGKVSPLLFEVRIRELVAGHPSLEKIADALL